jgi:hypothetical protein
MPELYKEIMEDIDSTMLDLFEKGLVDIEYDENLQAMFKVSEKAKEVLSEMGIDYLIDGE